MVNFDALLLSTKRMTARKWTLCTNLGHKYVSYLSSDWSAARVKFRTQATTVHCDDAAVIREDLGTQGGFQQEAWASFRTMTTWQKAESEDWVTASADFSIMAVNDETQMKEGWSIKGWTSQTQLELSKCEETCSYQKHT